MNKSHEQNFYVRTGSFSKLNLLIPFCCKLSSLLVRLFVLGFLLSRLFGFVHRAF